MDEAIIFDDVGSYPLPRGVRLDHLSGDQYLAVVREALEQKISAGVEVPNYPQFRDMIRMFMDPIEDPQRTESPYLVRRESAEIIELLAAPAEGQRLRVCVTGPVELYLSALGATCYEDILYLLARSVSRYLEKAQESGRVALASIDEPSLGLSSSILFEEGQILQALEIASEPCKRIDCEIHLHSPLFAELCCQAPRLSIIGVESAAHPDYLKLIEKGLLEETDTYLRAGIARTDILSLAARRNEQLGVNLWDDPFALEREILSLESPEVMERRLSAAYAIFGDRLRAAGPDCGLGSWPGQAMACRLLNQCALAIRSFRSKAKI